MRYFPFLLVIALTLLISIVSAYPIYVATGDPVSVHENKPGGSCWLFPSSGTGYEYDFTPLIDIENETFCSIPGEVTANLIPGTYTMAYQEPVYVGNKIFKDVSWVNNTLVSSFAQIKPIDESGKEAPIVLTDLKRLIETNQFNTFISETVFIEEPDLKLNEMHQTAENVYTASGTCNLINGTPITIKIDDKRYFSQHNDSFTYHTAVIRSSNEVNGVWSAYMPMPIQEMPPGWHEIAIYSRELITTSQFKIDEQKWGPAPTPTEYVKYLSNGDIEPVYINNTIIVIETHTEYIDKWHTATPTPDITDALGGKVNYPYKTGSQIPGGIALLALVSIAGLVIMRDWKWKR